MIIGQSKLFAKRCKRLHNIAEEKAMIEWIDLHPKDLQATMNKNCLTFNSACLPLLQRAYRVRVGIDEGKLVIYPISKERFDQGDLDERSLFEVKLKKSYARLCSTSLLSELAKRLSLDLSTPKRYPVDGGPDNEYLLIHTEVN